MPSIDQALSSGTCLCGAGRRSKWPTTTSSASVPRRRWNVSSASGAATPSVLQLPDSERQALLGDAVNTYSLDRLADDMRVATAAPVFTDMLFHLTVGPGYRKGPVIFASDWVEGTLLERVSIRQGTRKVREFLDTSGDVSRLAGFRHVLWRQHELVVWQRGG